MGTVGWWTFLAALSCQALQPHAAANGGSPRGASRAASVPTFVPESARGYRRFHANDSLIGLPLPCTRHEKLCFRYNLLFHPASKKCFPVDEYFYGDPQDFLHGSGHLWVAEHDVDRCTSEGGERAAFDGVCYKTTLYQEMLCGCKSPLSHHILGGVECRCKPPEPLFVEQPPEDGRCLIPDLRFSDVSWKKLHHSPHDEIQGFKMEEASGPGKVQYTPLRLRCSPQQQQCFSQWQLWLKTGCFSLLDRGPCPQDHVVALDAMAAANGSVEVTCFHERGGCPPGHVLAAYDGLCHREDELDVILPGRFHRNQFGEHVATPENVVALLFVLSVERNEGQLEDNCVLNVIFELASAGEPVARPACETNDDGLCSHFEVRVEPPLPEL